MRYLHYLRAMLTIGVLQISCEHGASPTFENATNIDLTIYQNASSNTLLLLPANTELEVLVVCEDSEVVTFTAKDPVGKTLEVLKYKCSEMQKMSEHERITFGASSE